jgi:hypothetical protein
VLVGPMPRYDTGKCSGGPGHGDKLDSDDFEEDIMEAQETHRHILTSWSVSKNIQAEYLDATALVSPGDPSLRCRKTSRGDLLWAPEHLPRHGVGRDWASSINFSENSFKQRRLESVITRPIPSLSKCGRGATATAG